MVVLVPGRVFHDWQGTECGPACLILLVLGPQVPGFYDQVAPGLIDLAWSSLEQHGGGEFSWDGYQVRGLRRR